MNLNELHNIYFIGIGGIGMSAIARYFAINDKNVAGYDKTPSPITNSLEEIGIKIYFEDTVNAIPLSFLKKEDALVVYTPAIPSSHKQLEYFTKNQFKILKRAEVLGLITKKTFCFAVAGTHGKTTTSAILGHIMESKKATTFLGGVAENYNSNLILGEDKISVVEADEYDRSFLQLSPNIACITSTDADHLDVYKESESLQQSFQDFSAKVAETLIVAKGLPLNGLTYAINEVADYQATNVKIKNGTYVFDVKTPVAEVKNVTFSLPGKHNVMNALAALAMADSYGVSLEVIKQRLQDFKGVKRRFSYKIKSEKIVLIDDYAHHPTEIKAVESSIREMYPNQKVLAIFQPHLFSRTKDFANEFAAELSKFDALLLLDIYPARELPIKGVTSSWLLDKISTKNSKLVSKEKLLSEVKKLEAKIIVIMGAGDVGVMVNQVEEILIKKYQIKK